jgi:hypothetical protein
VNAVDPDPAFPKVLDPDPDCEVQNAAFSKKFKSPLIFVSYNKFFELLFSSGLLLSKIQ